MTSRYPAMSEATTGVAQANAAGEHHPEALPPSDGATSAFAAQQLGGQLFLATGTRVCRSPRRRRARGVSSSRTASGSAPIDAAAARPCAAGSSGQARSSTCSPLRGSWRPTKTIWCSRSAGSASGGMSTPFGTTSYSPRKPARRGVARLRGDGDPVVDPVHEEAPERAAPSRIQPSSPVRVPGGDDRAPARARARRRRSPASSARGGGGRRSAPVRARA